MACRAIERLQQLRLPSLVICSALSLTLLVVRVGVSRTPTYLFLVWNLFLAWIPYFCSVAASQWRPLRWRRPWELLLISCWILFFPNAPYLMTDFVHLRARTPIPHWYDVALLTSFAWTGTILGLTSLQLVHERVRGGLGAAAGWVVVGSASTLAGAGIYIGRFLRWNSWDLVLRLDEVMWDVGSRFLDPFGFPSAWGVTLVFGALLFSLYVGFVSRDIRAMAVRCTASDA